MVNLKFIRRPLFSLLAAMRTIVLSLLSFYSVLANANGPDQWELFGMSSSGEKVHLAYGGFELEQANKGISTYLDPKRRAYGYCEPSASATEGQYFLSCSKQIGGKPHLTFRMDANLQNRNTREAKAPYSKLSKGKDKNRSFGGYYLCVQGCNPRVAKFLVEINVGD